MQSRTKKQDRKTLGSIYNETLTREQIYYDSEEDMVRAMADPKVWEESLWQTVDAYKQKYPNKNGFIQLIQIRDKFIPTRITMKWVARYSCPDPWFDETVWRYDARRDDLEYLWTLPDKETAQLYLKHQHTIVPEEQWMLKHVLDCASGKLDALCKELNGEKKDSVHILLKEVPDSLIVN